MTLNKLLLLAAFVTAVIGVVVLVVSDPTLEVMFGFGYVSLGLYEASGLA